MKQETITLLKAQLADHLEKQGSSLEEFEAFLAKQGGMDPLSLGADVIKETTKAVGGAVIHGTPALAGLSMGVGSTLGGAAYSGDKYISDQDKRLSSSGSEAKHLKRLTARLKQEHNLK